MTLGFLNTHHMKISKFWVPRLNQCPNLPQEQEHVFEQHSGQSSFWQNLSYSHNGTERILFWYKFYFVDRQKGKEEARTFIMSSNEFAKKDQLYCLLWTKGAHYASSVKALVRNVQISTYIVNNVSWITYYVVCPLGKLMTHGNSTWPHRISLTLRHCGSEHKNIADLIQPAYPADVNAQESICVCMTAQYGSVTDNDVPFFTQWIEMLFKFGVNKVVMYNSTMRVSGKFYHKIIKYYTQKGLLEFTQFPLPISHNPTVKDEELYAVEAIRSLAVNDCFYREIRKHWYFLHIDKDELPVPRNGDETYQQLLSKFLNTTRIIYSGEHNDTRHRTDQLPAIAMYSTFYYRSAVKRNKTVPNYLPLMKLVYRQPTEIPGLPAGYAKSFVNPRHCNHVWSHRCILAGDNEFTYIPENEVIVHHYRDFCPVEVIQTLTRRGQNESSCETESEHEFKDDYIGKHYGEFLTQRTLEVLKQINYH